MNDQIDELWGQCKTPLWSKEIPIYDHRLFAELIVQECISELEEMKRSGVPIPIQGGLNLGVVALKEHFGVEE